MIFVAVGAGAIMALLILSVILCYMALLNDDGYLDHLPMEVKDDLRGCTIRGKTPRSEERILEHGDGGVGEADPEEEA